MMVEYEVSADQNADIIDTIAAIATPPGRGGVGVIRVSGPLCKTLAQAVIGELPPPRKAVLRPFYHSSQEVIDTGLVLYFPGPNSFTGEDVLEFQGHGGPVIMDVLLNALLQNGARLANPGEFSQRAFLNDKLDLAQAEAIADLIEASTVEAAFCASRSLQGVFSRHIEKVEQDLMSCRMYVEAAIDFPEEEVDFLSDGVIQKKIEVIHNTIHTLLHQAQQGQLLKEGLLVAIVGQPNAGKSSLMNCLTQYETAIVTPIPGTTRDLIKETIQIDGLPIHIVDTAGIREEGDLVEQEGIRRSQEQQKLADKILLIIDATQTPLFTPVEEHILEKYGDKVTVVMNKIDLCQTPPIPTENTLFISAKTGAGVKDLLAHLKQSVGFQGENGGLFIARRRHLHALESAVSHIKSALKQLIEYKAGECVAEELRLAQMALGEIIGKVTPDDVLGEIFSRFCIGK